MSRRSKLSVQIALLLFAAGALWSQEFRATLSGKVMDQQQAVLPGVRITVVQVDTGSRTQVTSGSDGLYTAPFLPPGNYSVTAQAQGFKKFARTGLQLTTNERCCVAVYRLSLLACVARRWSMIRKSV